MKSSTPPITFLAVLAAFALVVAGCGATLDDASGPDRGQTSSSPFPSNAKTATSLITVNGNQLNQAQQVALSALQGLLARSSTTQIYSLVSTGDSYDQWLAQIQKDQPNIKVSACNCEANDSTFWTFVNNMWSNLGNVPKQYVLYSSAPGTLNSMGMASSLSGICNALPVDSNAALAPSFQSDASGAGFGQKVDATNLTTSQLISTYGSSSNPCGTALATDVAVELNPGYGSGLCTADPTKGVYGMGSRDYAAMNNAIVFFDCDAGGGVPNLNSVLGYLQPPAPIFGWGNPQGNGETDYVSPTGGMGDFYVAADWARNLPVLSGLAAVTAPLPAPSGPTKVIEPQPAAPSAATAKPVASTPNPKKSSSPDVPKGSGQIVYATFLMSDGDNLQWLLNRGDNNAWWGNSYRGQTPIGWTMSPSLYYLAPTVWNYYASTATDNDQFLGGPSGIGYTFGNVTNNSTAFNGQLADLSEFLGGSGVQSQALFGYNDWGNTTYLGGALDQTSAQGGFYFEYAGWITPSNTSSTQWFNNKPMIPANEDLENSSWSSGQQQSAWIAADLCGLNGGVKNNGIYAIYVDAWGNASSPNFPNGNPMASIQQVVSAAANCSNGNTVQFVSPSQLVQAAINAKSTVLPAPEQSVPVESGPPQMSKAP